MPNPFGNVAYLQGGGPTSVVNATFVGLFEAFQKEEKEQGRKDRFYFSPFGVQGLLSGSLLDETDRVFSSEAYRPGSYFGSSRISFVPEDPRLEAVAATLRKFDVHALFLTGGNDTMLTAMRISDYLKERSFPCSVIGIPKTVDNDLYGVDHTPGYGSAAKFIANAVLDLTMDERTYETGRIYLVECMGRDSGYLAAASKLAALRNMEPDAIYVPEVPFDVASFLDRTLSEWKQKKRLVVVLSEGIRTKDGTFVSATGTKDSFGNPQLGGAALRLSALLEQRGAKTRAVELNALQRSATFLLSRTDFEEAKEAGRQAYALFRRGENGKMVTLLRRSSSPYQAGYGSIDLGQVGGRTTSLPLSFVSPDGAHIEDSFLSYVLPLIQGEVKTIAEDGLLAL